MVHDSSMILNLLILKLFKEKVNRITLKHESDSLSIKA